MWLWSAACLSPVQRTLDPGLKADKPHQNHPFVINVSQSGKLLGGGKWGRTVHVFKSGRMMFKHKNKFFSFPETLFIYYFKSFYLFVCGGVNWQMPWGHSCVLGPCGQWELGVPHWVCMAGRVRWPASGHIPGSCALTPGMDRTGNLSLGIDTGEGLSSVSVWGKLTRNTQLTLFSFFCFRFYKGKGGLSVEQPHATWFFMLYCFVLFCFVNCIIFKYLSFKKRRKSTKKILVKALRRG